MRNSAIEWTHHTFNPWIGCTQVSPACDHCYAMVMMDHRYQRVEWGPARLASGQPSTTGNNHYARVDDWRCAARSGLHKIETPGDPQRQLVSKSSIRAATIRIRHPRSSR